ncbi:MAG: hypothetical protein NC429_07935 [Lachnospiraceae bacterium]|nr:hypothetical protein [Lachnospiraceae bacterium]
MSESDTKVAAKIAKIKKSSNAALIVVKILKTFCIIMTVVSIGCGCAFIAAKDYIDQEFARALETGELELDEIYINAGGFLDSALNMAEVESVAVTVGTYLFAIGIVLICFSVLAHCMGKIFKDIKESYSPFQQEIIKNFKVVFVLITLLALYNSLLIGAAIGFSLWCMFWIFEYGCELQRQSDETL